MRGFDLGTSNSFGAASSKELSGIGLQLLYTFSNPCMGYILHEEFSDEFNEKYDDGRVLVG